MKSYKPKKPNAKKRFELNKRESATKRGYNIEWIKYRSKFIKHNPKCYTCGSSEKINVDHIKAHKGNDRIFWDTHNHMPLCQSCHSTVTGKFDRMRIQDLDGKINWIKEQRKKNGVSTPIKVIPTPN